MSDLEVSAAFTESSGVPATGLVLAEIDLYLYSTRRSDGLVTQIWNTVNPTAEIPNLGHYIRLYSGADLDLNNYHARAEYTGATVLDTDNVTGVTGVTEEPVGTAIDWEYRVLNDATLQPIEGVEVWFWDEDETYVTWYGVTDANGYAKDVHDHNPRLDAGVYKVHRQKAEYTFADPDTETVVP